MNGQHDELALPFGFVGRTARNEVVAQLSAAQEPVVIGRSHVMAGVRVDVWQDGDAGFHCNRCCAFAEDLRAFAKVRSDGTCAVCGTENPPAPAVEDGPPADGFERMVRTLGLRPASTSDWQRWLNARRERVGASPYTVERDEPFPQERFYVAECHFGMPPALRESAVGIIVPEGVTYAPAVTRAQRCTVYEVADGSVHGTHQLRRIDDMPPLG
jgi:hypothetical protein